MPARTNEFQQLVLLIQKQLATNSLVTVTESKMLADKRSHREREVDVVVEFSQQGAPFILSIECRGTKRKLGIEAMEQLIKKHEVRSDKLIVVSQMGFTKSAVECAVEHRVEAVTLEAASKVDWGAYVGEFEHLRLGLFTMQVIDHKVDYKKAEGSPLLDLSQPLVVADMRGQQLPFPDWMRQIVQNEKIRDPVMDAWFKVPNEERASAFDFNFEYRPAESLRLLQSGSIYEVVAVRARVSVSVSTGPLAVKPISFMNNELLHGSAPITSGNDAKIQLVVAAPSSHEMETPTVSILFPATGSGRQPEIAHGRLRFPNGRKTGGEGPK